MKKRLLSMFLSVCMVLSLLPVSVLAYSSTPDETYSYAYDAQRNPIFPDSSNVEITASGFAEPLKFGSTQSSYTRYDSSAGSWTLSEAGTYAEASTFDPAPTSFLDGVVASVATSTTWTRMPRTSLLSTN